MREAVITVLLTSSLMCGATEDHTQFKLQKGTHKPIYPWKTVKFQSAYPRQGRGGAGTYTRLRHCRQAVAGPDNHSHLRSAWSHRWTLPHLCDWRWSSWRVYRENPQTGSESVKLNDECVMNVHLESIINFSSSFAVGITTADHLPPSDPTLSMLLLFYLHESSLCSSSFPPAGSSISSVFSPVYPPSLLCTSKSSQPLTLLDLRWRTYF